MILTILHYKQKKETNINKEINTRIPLSREYNKFNLV